MLFYDLNLIYVAISKSGSNMVVRCINRDAGAGVNCRDFADVKHRIKHKIRSYDVNRLSKTYNKKIISIFGNGSNKMIHHCHATISEINKDLEKIWENPFLKRENEFIKFTFVRNPYDRWVSIFNWGKVFPYHKPKDRRIPKDISFEQFCYEAIDEDTGKIIYKTFKDNNYLSFRPAFRQIDFCVNDNGSIGLDFIGKVENVVDDWKKLQKLAPKLPDFMQKYIGTNYNPSRIKKHYSEYYNKDTQDLVYLAFKEDFETFGYNYKMEV